ncbi:hypothetical protein FACUT_8325 [Fusarium acutatum]|uniref:Uncharacterized protein n=1 Tax=Fusarium acutatum TaxID=78861 RepID=A0A8H4NPC5_9HYPO|nr:hypothetical protein FACUT_8325 [Fusarium acutatum]
MEASLTSPLFPQIAWLHEVHAAIFAVNIEDTRNCECSMGGCTMLRLLLMELVEDCTYKYVPRRFHTDSSENITSSAKSSEAHENALLELIANFLTYLEHFSCHLRPRHQYATLRYITHIALGTPPAYHLGSYSHGKCGFPLYPVEDDLEDDESHKLDLLEDLLKEFEENITSILEDTDKGVRDLIYFWKIIWVSLMSEVLDRLEESDLTEDERLAAEEFGVVWNKVGPEPPEPGPGKTDNPY